LKILGEIEKEYIGIPYLPFFFLPIFSPLFLILLLTLPLFYFLETLRTYS